MRTPSELIQAARDLVSARRWNYIHTFNNPEGEKVLRDLAKFCHVHDGTHHADQRLSDKLEGRRQVWLRIQQHLQISDKDLWTIYRIGNDNNE